MKETHAEIQHDFLEGLLSGGHRNLLIQIQECLDGGPRDAQAIRTFYLDVFFPVLADLDVRYASGSLSHHDYQVASITAARVETALYSQLPDPEYRRGQAVVCRLPGKPRDMGHYLLSDLMELDGWDVPVLPAKSSVEDIHALLTEIHPFLLILAIACREDYDEALRFSRDIREGLNLPTLHPVIIGNDLPETDATGDCLCCSDPGDLLASAAAMWDAEGRPYSLGMSFPVNYGIDGLSRLDIASLLGIQPTLQAYTTGRQDVLGTMTDMTLDMMVANRRLVRRNHELEAVNFRLLDMTETDYLTGVRNRRFAYSQLDSYFSYKKRNSHFVFSAVMFDLDEFKRINDVYGHVAGDSVLVAVSRRVREVLRREDMLARIGGDEFLVTLFNQSIEDAVSVAEKIRRIIETIDIPGVGHITGSFGATQIADGDDTKRLTSRADEAMYAAKTGGRNRTVVL